MQFVYLKMKNKKINKPIKEDSEMSLGELIDTPKFQKELCKCSPCNCSKSSKQV